jgi:phage terminase small subunit
MMAELTEKQKRFADYYIESGNATEAYKRAYGSENEKTAAREGHRLMQNHKISQYIHTRMSEKDNERIASQDEVLQFLTDVMRGNVTEKVPVLAGMGVQELVDNTPAIKDREKAAELLGKRYMLWTEKVEHSGNVGVNIINDIPRRK